MDLFIRADADSKIGTGHIMRCIALAQAWQNCGGSVTFISHCESEGLRERILKEGFEFLFLEKAHPDPSDLEQTLSILATKTPKTNSTNPTNQSKPPWVVLDGYHFEAEYQRCIKESGLQLLVIDDFGHLKSYVADLVLNQDLCAEEILYRNRASFTRLLLGQRYALIRREFSEWREWNRAIADVGRKILVTMGGGDPDNVTVKVIQSLQQVDVDELEAVVVAGATNTRYEELRAEVQSSRVPIRLEQNVKNMPKLMGWADVAISAGGSTCWELSLMGLPTMMLILAENQYENTRLLHLAGAIISLGWHREVACEQIVSTLEGLCKDRDLRANLSHVSRGLVDGRGAARVVCLMMDRESDHAARVQL